ncbi:DUF1343 domain-containing protein [Aeoliella sp. ICT_H6.2]|uniref:DUF1343 domain-containing protein n=1 Tax=Aeoliella straminimaris TaxID=2954799 RepID=A0A9X2FH51_9BACT|nr:DUF1343 domain-containing protein [Aeoliella straminimaris]MCO6044476.1 DUF1343 domain-containing protein [Aeoliella straminimaris]
MSSPRVGYGIDEVVSGHASPPAGGRYGLLTNDAARAAGAPHKLSRRALLDAGVRLVRLFSPEHGIAATAADGASVPDGVDPVTGLEVVSLYGERMRPEPAMLDGLDGVLVDLPDIGARFYTFIWSMSHMLEACGQAGLPVWVLDRPNPIGGDLAAAEGPMLDVGTCASFLGRYAMPIRHSITMGELACLWNDEQHLDVDLKVVPAVGWNRADHQPASGVPFVPTSPAMPRYTSALFYPGVCLFEATNLSVGRGTAHPFEQIGAPWLDAEKLNTAFASLGLPGVESQPVQFTPVVPPHEGQCCEGVRLKVVDAQALRPVAMGLLLLACAMQHSRGEFHWHRYPTAANPQGDCHFELLVGRQGVAAMLADRSADLRQRVETLTAVPDWRERVEPHLIYS